MNNEIMINKRRIRFTQIGSIILCLLFLTAFGNTYLIQPSINDDARIAKDLVLYNAVSTYATEGPIYDRNGNIISQNSTLAYPENYSYSWLLGYYSTSLGMENVYGLRGNLKDYLYFLLDKDNVGAKVTLTTDSRIQNYAHESILQGIEGSVIVLDNKTGAILALASQSTVNYDGNDPMFILQSEIEGSQFRRGTYENDPPGSTFKIITSIAALEKSRDEQLDESFFSFNDTGTYIPEGDQFEIRNYNNIAYGQIGLNE
ncbi:MAG: hypothetical protein IJ875_03950, partial [Solobacterium sp.]|nr:hypothetical protein [Solobacterium sp.]